MSSALSLHPKVTASGLAGAVVVVIVYSLHQWAHVDLPDVVSAALTVIVGFAGGYLAPSADPAPAPAAVAASPAAVSATAAP
jgi:hypothetical protein